AEHAQELAVLHQHRLDGAALELVALSLAGFPLVLPAALRELVGVVEGGTAHAHRAAVQRRIVTARVPAAERDGGLGQTVEPALLRLPGFVFEQELLAGEEL